jgi:uncharacterized membrane protein
MSIPDDRSLPIKILLSSHLRWALFSLSAMLALVAVISLVRGFFDKGGQLAGVAAAFATLLLVSLTAQYAEQTQQLVEENRKTRIESIEQRRKRRTRELKALRRALKEEIQKVQFDDLAEDYAISMSINPVFASSTVYEENAAKIGLLTDEEVDYIVEYYTRLDLVEGLMNVQRQLDTTADMGYFEELFRRSEAIVKYIVRIVSFGHLQKDWPNRREETIREEIQKLSESQDAAVEAIHEQLEDMGNERSER